MKSGVNVFLPETRYEFSMYTNAFTFLSKYYAFCYLEAYRLTDFTSHITPLPVSVVNIRKILCIGRVEHEVQKNSRLGLGNRYQQARKWK